MFSVLSNIMIQKHFSGGRRAVQETGAADVDTRLHREERRDATASPGVCPDEQTNKGGLRNGI